MKFYAFSLQKLSPKFVQAF